MSPPPRKKASRPKTTTGCRTCRIRRIKCDEAEPSCGQCIRGRRVCDGYPRKMGLLRQQDRTLSLSNTALTGLSGPPGNLQEKRCFDFFCRRTVPQLCGSFESSFWSQSLLLATHHEPAIQHAVIALGALHEFSEYQLSAQAEHHFSFALRQYVRAIGLLVSRDRERSERALEVALITCILFVSFETLRGYHSAALSHIDGGLKIVSELQSYRVNEKSPCSSGIPYVPLCVFNQLFVRLDAQVSQMGISRRRRLLCENTPAKYSGFESKIPPLFCSLEEARDSLDYIRTCADRSLQTLPVFPDVPDKAYVTSMSPAVLAEIKLSLALIRSSSAVKLRQWSLAFKTFIVNRPSLTLAQERAARILQLHRMINGVHLSVDFFRIMSPMAWDEYSQDFESIITEAEAIIRLSPVTNGANFTMDTEIIMPVGSAAIQCRDGRVRRRAIALLRSSNMQEGIWNSLLTARVVERVMEIEEAGLDGRMGTTASITMEKRHVGLRIKLDPAFRKADFLYTMPTTGEGIETTHEILEWLGIGA